MTDENLATTDEEIPQELPPETIGEEVAAAAADDAKPPSDEDDQDPDFEPLTPAQQRVVDKGFDKRTKAHYDKLRAEQQAREAAEAKLAELSEKIPKPQRPVVPPIPNEFDDDFEAKIIERDRALLAQAQFDNNQMLSERQAQYQAQKTEQEHLENLKKEAANYAERAATAKVDPAELQEAGNLVASYQLSDEVVQRILKDPLGPEITLHLSKNLAQLTQLREMHPIDAAVFLATTVADKVREGRKKTTTTPPAPHLRGAGIPERQRGPKGATFT